ncbi:uncharacterized protein BDZ99DRAFT_545868, partial [Mytilinidion resinicola]
MRESESGGRVLPAIIAPWCKVVGLQGSLFTPLAREGSKPDPTVYERFWVSVAWPSSGGLVVSEYDTTLPGFSKDTDDFVPDDVARLRLCISMDERAAMLLERYQGKTFRDVSEYRGNACI